jgi:tRNA(fMet)-specific endonuclease VapC
MAASTAVLLDTDTLSAILRRHPVARTKAQVYLQVYQQFTFSAMTRYELLRGLKVKQAVQQQAAFDHFCAANSIVPLTDAIIVQAAEVYANLYQRGAMIGDADILIAATALVEGYTVATNNMRHFGRIPGLAIDNWLV